MDSTAKLGRRLVPTALAAMAAGVSDGTIRKWASRGKLNRFGSPQKAMYDLDELLRLIAEGGGGAPREPEAHRAPPRRGRSGRPGS